MSNPVPKFPCILAPILVLSVAAGAYFLCPQQEKLVTHVTGSSVVATTPSQSQETTPSAFQTGPETKTETAESAKAQNAVSVFGYSGSSLP